MKKRTKIIISIIVVLVVCVELFFSNYLVSFAVGRTTSGGTDVVPEASTSEETDLLVGENIVTIWNETQDWLETIPRENVSITSDDGLKLVGEKSVIHSDSHKWVIAIHGYTMNHNTVWDYGHIFADKGYNLLLPDMRGHGESEGDYIGMGWPDRKDVVKWIQYICDMDPNAEIILYGISMGAGTVMMTSGEELPSNVKCIVEDCGYTSVWDIFSDELKILFHLPEFPLLYTASTICKFRAGYSFQEASALQQISNVKVPVLFIHGSEDNFVHTEMVYELYEACPTDKDIMVVENAGHGQSYYYAPEAYKDKIYTFIETYN